MMQFAIEQSAKSDLNIILELYDFARRYQKLVFPENVWPIFESKLVINEINKRQQYKLIGDGKVVCVWAITDNDPLIWRDKNVDSALYIHRIATHPDHHGYNFVSQIVNWAKAHALSKNIDYLRLDTCGYNTRLIEHYKTCGFDFLGTTQLENTVGLPEHYRDADVCYFEIKL